MDHRENTNFLLPCDNFQLVKELQNQSLAASYYWLLEIDLSVGGADRARTGDLLLAKQVLSQLSYSPKPTHEFLVGLGGFEPPTSPLSGVRSNQLSYRPKPVRSLGSTPTPFSSVEHLPFACQAAELSP